MRYKKNSPPESFVNTPVCNSGALPYLQLYASYGRFSASLAMEKGKSGQIYGQTCRKNVQQTILRAGLATNLERTCERERLEGACFRRKLKGGTPALNKKGRQCDLFRLGWVSDLHRAATTKLPLLRSSPGGFQGSWPYRTYPYVLWHKDKAFK